MNKYKNNGYRKIEALATISIQKLVAYGMQFGLKEVITQMMQRAQRVPKD
jgi:hypothetical protein